jgi:PAS domain S-box-containing protein
VWTWIPETGEVTVGASWRVVFGVEPDTVVTFQTWENAVHSDDRKIALDKLDSAWRNRSDFSAEYRVVRPDGTVRWVADRGRPFQDASGSIVGMAGVNLDITKRRNAEESALHANRLKDEFLATLSHELRTPLNAIVGWTDMLRRRKLDEAHAGQAMEAVFRNAKTLTEIINDVLDVSRIISGKVQIEMRPVDPNEVLTNAVESVRPAADAKGITIVTECGTTPFPLSADPTRLQQVFWNLLSNAVKFTPPGGEIRVASHLSDAKLQVRITDTGIGISQDFLPYVFDRFRQRDSSTTRMHGGLGLGLAIVRHLVEMHGGTVTAESAGEGHGSTFVVTIPANRFQERRSGESIFTRHVPAVESPPDDVPSLCGIRVLVVDDEEEARAVAASVLRSHGATVSVAATPTNALEDFGRFDPHVLLVDVAMPEMDGYAFIERVRTLCGPKGAAVPAIAFTAYAREEDQRRALASGFRLHLAKPVDAHTLVRAIASVQR